MPSFRVLFLYNGKFIFKMKSEPLSLANPNYSSGSKPFEVQTAFLASYSFEVSCRLSSFPTSELPLANKK